MKPLPFLVLIAAAFLASSAAPAQNPSPSAAAESEAAGDQPDDPGPLATNLSPKIKRAAVLKAMKTVADWQLKEADSRYNTQWTFAALYDGLLAASRATGDNRYHDRVLEVARQNKWSLGPRFAHADDEAIGLTYLAFYAEQAAQERITPTREGMDKLLARPDDPKENLWWWCDALYMAPPVLTQLSIATRDQKYLDFMDHEWWLTSAALFDPAEHLYYRDNRFLTMHEAMVRGYSGRAATGGFSPAWPWCLRGCPSSILIAPNFSLNIARWPSALRHCSSPMDYGARASSTPVRISLPRSPDPRFSPSPSPGASIMASLTVRSICRSSPGHGPACSSTSTKMADWGPFSRSVASPANSSPPRVMSTE